MSTEYFPCNERRTTTGPSAVASSAWASAWYGWKPPSPSKCHRGADESDRRVRQTSQTRKCALPLTNVHALHVHPPPVVSVMLGVGARGDGVRWVWARGGRGRPRRRKSDRRGRPNGKTSSGEGTHSWLPPERSLRWLDGLRFPRIYCVGHLLPANRANWHGDPRVRERRSMARVQTKSKKGLVA